MMARKYSTHPPNKRRRELHPADWCNLHSDLLGKIFNGLNAMEKRCIASICRSWRTLAKEEINSFLKSSVPKSPHLLLPDGLGGYMGKSGCCMLSLDDDALKPVNNEMLLIEGHDILGSCRGGWLLLTTKKTNLILWNPLIDEIKIHLPSVHTFPSVFKDSSENNWITKAAIFGSDPLISSDCGVVVIYGGGKLAFVNYGDSQWSDLIEAASNYIDVTSNKDSILALSNKGEVEVWNFSTDWVIPKKTMEISAPFPRDMVESKEPLRDKYNRQLYIVMGSQDSVLMVVRWVANFVDTNLGVLLTEDDLIQLDDPFLIAPYHTKKFYVYKLDSDAKRWIGVESLGNQVLFLGGNQSLSILHAEDYIEKNSIYFTDDYWGRTDEHECYGGHDMGIFNLEDESIQEICGFEADKMLPPFWVL